MNLLTLKLDFYNYLEKEGKLDEQKAEDLLSSDISIFMYSAEFEKFIDEKGSDYNIPENFSGNYSDLIEMAFDSENCQFISNEYSGKTGDENQDIKMIELLNDMFKQDEVKDVTDIDHDGKISNDEMKNFLQLANQYDGDKESFSLDDIFKVMDGIKEGTFNPAYGIIPKELQGEEEIKLQEQLSTEAAEKVNGDSSKVSSSGNSSGGGTSTTPNRKGANDDSKAAVQNISNIDAEIVKYKNEIIEKNKEKSALMSDNQDYQSKISELNTVTSAISKNESNITEFEQTLHETQTQISTLNSELENLQDPVLFTEYQGDINNKRKEIKAEIEKKEAEAAKLQEKIIKEQEDLKNNTDKEKELKGIISGYESEKPNAEIDKINQEITEIENKIKDLEDNKKELQTNLATTRENEISDAKVYGKAKAYRESNEFTRWMMDYATSNETRNRYDSTNFGGAWCAIFTSEVTEKLYAEVAKRLGISTNQSQGMDGDQVAMHAIAWGNKYQSDFEAIGLKQKATINVTNMTEQQRKDAVRNGLIYPGMTFEYESNGGYHTGFIESINEDLTWNTIEGNSTGGKTGSHVRDASNNRLSSATDTTLKCMYWLVKKGIISAEEANKRLYGAA